MPRVDVRQFILFKIQHGIHRRDEHPLLGIGDQQIVHAAQRFGGRFGFQHGGADEGPRERHEERGRHALVRNVRDEQADAIIRQVNHVVKVAAHLPRRFPTRRKFPALHLRQRVGDERLLNLASQLHFRFEAFAHHHLALQQVVLNRKRGLLRDPVDDLQPPRAESQPAFGFLDQHDAVQRIFHRDGDREQQRVRISEIRLIRRAG